MVDRFSHHGNRDRQIHTSLSVRDSIRDTSFNVALCLIFCLGACGRVDFELLDLSDGTDNDNTGTGADSGSDADDGAGVDPGSDADHGAGADSGSDSDDSAGADSGSDSDDSAGADSGSDADDGAGADSGSDADDGAGTDSGSDAGTDAGDADTDTGFPSCSDGIENGDETGVDCGGSTCPACSANDPPVPVIAVTPGVGWHDGASPTLFTADATGTSDDQDAPGALTYSWDWGDGSPLGSGSTHTHTYGAAGIYDVVLTVTDTDGQSASKSFLVVVNTESNVIAVTTQLDENDPNPVPGPDLSLREAIVYANAAAGWQSIIVPSGFIIDLTDVLPSPTDAAGLDIVGDGAIVDGSGTDNPDGCFPILPGDTNVFGFEIRNCKQEPIGTQSSTTGTQLSRLYVHDNAKGVNLNGSGNVFGPYNAVERSSAAGVDLIGPAEIIWNDIIDNTGRGINITASATGSFLLGNVVAGNDYGLFITGDDHAILHNTCYANANAGTAIGANTTGIVFENNIMAHNGTFGLVADDADFDARGNNDFYNNTLGFCSSCGSLGTGSLTDDPLFIDGPGGDFRLTSSSTLIDAGTDTGYDVNGSGAGLFWGANPDIGARERP